MSGRFRLVFQILLLGAVLVLLGWLNRFPEVDNWFPAPGFAPWLRGHLLPAVFALVVGMGWAAWWLWNLILPETDRQAHPDIDAAWDEAVAALDAAGLGLSDLPLFLIVGRTASGEESLFSASQVVWTVENVPADPEAPLHVYANEEAIYVTCAALTLLGCQTALWAGDPEWTIQVAGLDLEDAPTEGTDDDAFKTLQPKGKMQDVQAVLAKAAAEGRAPHQITEDEREQIRILIGAELDSGTGVRAGTFSLLKRPVEVERLVGRLGHLCRLIALDRRPFCPLNGVLVLIPYAATDSDDNAVAAGGLCRADLGAARTALGVYCPVLAMLCDLETAPGFREFVKRFPAEQRQRRLGQRFPLVPDLNAQETTAMLAQGTEWICRSMFPNWVYKLFRLECSSQEDFASVTDGNTQLYRLMSQMQLRHQRLSQLAVRGLLPEDDVPALFGGCYIAATGPDAANDQAFVPGVFRRLLENQNFLSWTDEALDEDTRQQRWTTLGYLGMGLAVACLAAAGALIWSRTRP